VDRRKAACGAFGSCKSVEFGPQGLSDRIDPAELQLAVCLSRRHNPIARSFGN